MKKILLETIGKSMGYTLAVAEIMPAEFYNSRLTKDNWNFAEMLSHIAYGITWWQETMVEGKKAAWAPPAAATSKQAVIMHMKEAFNALSETVSGMEVNDDVTYGCFATLDHITHHRGQAVLFLRNKGLTPPEYVF